MDTFTNTQVLAFLLGLYFLAASMNLLTDGPATMGMIKELIAQPALGFLSGIAAFSIGGAIIATHYDWSSLLSSFITLVGWIAVAEGFLLIACRKWFLGIFEKINFSTGIIKIFGIAILIIGILLIWASIGI